MPVSAVPACPALQYNFNCHHNRKNNRNKYSGFKIICYRTRYKSHKRRSPRTSQISGQCQQREHCSPAIITQNTLLLQRSSIVIPLSPSSISGAIGTFAKTNALITGINAQIHASIFQFAMPKIPKKTVDNSTTPTCPQQ